MSAAVVTGVGVAAPTGLGTDEYWRATLAAANGIRPISRFDAGQYPVRLAGEVAGFASAESLPSRLTVQTDQWTHLGLAAAGFALDDAGVDPALLPEYDMAVTTASSSGGTEFGQREIEKLWAKGPQYVGAYQSIAWFYAATTGQISIRHGMRGPCGVICTEQAGGLDVLGQARRLVRNGTQLVVTGGTDSFLCPYGLVAQLSNGALSERHDPDRAYLPFDVDACGYVPGEGGAMLVVEDAEAARRRGVRPYATIAGYAATFDGAGNRCPPALRRALELALADAGRTPSDVDVVFADGAGLPEADGHEAAAIRAVFGPRGVPVTVPKTMTGRLYAGGAALDVAAALLAIRDGLIPPTIGTGRPVPGHDLDLVLGEPRPAAVRTALVLARGYGGFNAALVLAAADDMDGGPR